jgi:hypothetical protein
VSCAACVDPRWIDSAVAGSRAGCRWPADAPAATANMVNVAARCFKDRCIELWLLYLLITEEPFRG